MNAPSSHDGVNRKRLFAGICLALIPTGAQFALLGNVVGQLKAEFLLSNTDIGYIVGGGVGAMAISLLVLGPWLEKYGMRAGTAMAFLGHIGGLTIVLSAAIPGFEPIAFWLLFSGAMLMAVGNGMIEVAGNPLTTALYPDDKTTKLNWFHAFFPLGITAGALLGAGMNMLGIVWTIQLSIIYIPMIVYAIMVLPQKFPKTEYGESGLPFGDMFVNALKSPMLFMMMLMLALALCIELGTGRFIPEIFYHAGFGGLAILLIAWYSLVMVALRLFAAGTLVRVMTPPGMLFAAGALTFVALLLFSGADNWIMAFIAATIFGMGLAFFFPTIVGMVAERAPQTGSLGIVVTMGFGLGFAGWVGNPIFGGITDAQVATYLNDESRQQTLELLFSEYDDQNSAEVVFERELERISGMSDEELAEAGIIYVPKDIEGALAAIRDAHQEYQREQRIGDAVPAALRATGGVPMEYDRIADFYSYDETDDDDNPLTPNARAAALESPAEAWGGQRAMMIVSPLMLVIMVVYGGIFLYDRTRGGYKAEKLVAGGGEQAAEAESEAVGARGDRD